MENGLSAAEQADQVLVRAIATAVRANAMGLALPRTMALIDSFVDARLKARDTERL